MQDKELPHLFIEFLKSSKTNHAPSSFKRYRAIINNFETFLEGFPYLKKISQLTPKTFEDYKSFRRGQGASNKTINVELQTLRAMFNLAVNWGYTKENPTKGIKMLKEDKQRLPRFLDKEEVNVLLENCGEKLYPIFYTFLYTGMRKGELENLEWADIDLKRKRIKIRIKDSWRPKTTEREIPINTSLTTLLKKHKKTQQGRYVFHKEGKKIEPNSLRKKFIRITKKCGFPEVTKLHTLRHTYASHLAMKGETIRVIKEILGHSDIKTTMIYAHLAEKHVDSAVKGFKY